METGSDAGIRTVTRFDSMGKWRGVSVFPFNHQAVTDSGLERQNDISEEDAV